MTHLPDIMQAWQLTGKGRPREVLSLVQLPVPQPQPGEVLLRVSHFGLNFAEVMACLGLYRDAPPLPAVLGYDVAGEVVALGAGVTDWEIGERVIALTRFGGYAEYATTDAQALARLPDAISREVGVALAVQGITAQYMANYLQPLRAGEQVLIHAAAGGVGSLLVQLAKQAGCYVYGTVGSAGKMELLRELGVDQPINYREQDFAEHIRQHGGQRPLHVVFDPIGGPTLKQGMTLLAPGGRMVSFGGSSFTEQTGFFKKLWNFWQTGFVHPLVLVGGSRSICGVNMLRLADHQPEIITRLLAECVDLVRNQVLDPYIFSTENASQLPECLSIMQERKTTGKLVLKW